MTPQTLIKLRAILRNIHDYGCIEELLGWDQQVMMPTKGMEARSRQLGLVAELAHNTICSNELGDLLEEAYEVVAEGSQEAAMVREAQRDREIALRLPAPLVKKITEVTAEAHARWVKARVKDDFGVFAPILKEIVALKREQASALMREDTKHPYDTLMDEYEPNATVEWMDPLVERAASVAQKVYEEVQGSTVSRPGLPAGSFDLDGQKVFCGKLLEWIGFDMEAGRLDASVHPFTCGFDPGDVRLTTRYNADEPFMAFFSTLHEGGHGLYEQGLPKEHVGTPLAQALSLGLHESQSRFWENRIGRSLSFWRFAESALKKIFPRLPPEVTPENIYFAVNRVEASLCRTESDEVTYNLHIALRYELEKALLIGDLEVDDLEDTWNCGMEKYLGVRPRSPKEGVLQDIHWSMGLFGYFGTYLLGNLYAAQWAQAMENDMARTSVSRDLENASSASSDLTKLDHLIEKGEFLFIRDWLKSNIHSHGRRYPADELSRRLIGGLDSRYFESYIKKKYSRLYNIEV